jgi:hypothetical protein
MPDENKHLQAVDSTPLDPDSTTTVTHTWDIGEPPPAVETDARLIAWGGAVKSIAPNRIGGYLAVWGSPAEKDAQGEYFTPDTDFALDYYANRPALYHHTLDATLGGLKVGTIDTLKLDEAGLWAEAQIEEHNAYVQKIRELVDKGVLGWSSGSVPHWVDVDKSGQIKRWPIVEGSLTPTPADWRGKTRVMTMKAYLEQVSIEAGEPLSDASLNSTPAHAADASAPTEPQAEEAAVTEVTANGANAAAQPAKAHSRTMRGKTMNVASIIAAMQEQGIEADKILAIVAGMAGETAAPAMDADVSEETQREEEEQVIEGAMSAGKSKKSVDLDAVVAAKVEAALKSQAKPVSAASAGGISEVRDRRFDYADTNDLAATAHFMLNGAKKGLNPPPSLELMRALHERLSEDVEAKDAKLGRVSRSALKAALSAANPVIRGAAKADEIFSTVNGSQFVSEAWDTRVIETVRFQPVYQRMTGMGLIERTIPQGASTLNIPVEGNDPTAYSLPAGSAIDDMTGDEKLPQFAKVSTVTAQTRAVQAGVLMFEVAYDFISEEDMVVNIGQYINGKLNAKAAEVVERIMFEGDTATAASTNINYADTTPAIDAKGRRPDVLLTDAIFKHALVTNTGVLSLDAANTLSETTYLNALRLLSAAQRADKSRLMYVIDSATHYASLNIAAFKTKDVNTNATIEGGALLRVWGIPVIESGFIGDPDREGKTNTSGLRAVTTSTNNTRGRIAIIRPDRWIVGMKRQMTTESVRDPQAQATIVISTTRFAMHYVDSAGGVGVVYNVAV